MLNILKLKGKIAENGMNITSLARKIGMNRDTLYRKLANEGEKLNLGEIKKICEVLKINKEDTLDIFMNM
ncbi:MAG: helix-turn-helix domain-containing protein [Peptoniphilus senegalensis]